MAVEPPRIRTGLAGLDEILGGGLEEGTSCLISGESGTGKSTLAAFDGIRIGEPLMDFTGVPTGSPVYPGREK